MCKRIGVKRAHDDSNVRYIVRASERVNERQPFRGKKQKQTEKKKKKNIVSKWNCLRRDFVYNNQKAKIKTFRRRSSNRELEFH